MENYTKWPGINKEKIGVTYHSLEEKVESHMHDFLEIAFILSGKCRHRYCDSEITLIAGDIFIIAPDNCHSYELDDKTEIYNCLFYPSVLGDDWNALKNIDAIFDMLMVEPFYREESGKQKILHLKPHNAQIALDFLKSIMSADKNMEKGYRLKKKAILILYLIFLSRQWEKQQNTKNQIIDTEKKDLILDAITYMEKNYLNNINIKEIASQIYLSPQYFSKIFKTQTGLTPIKYINNMRIKKAEAYLANTKYSISKISQLVGIDDVNYFSRLFKSANNISPTSYRKKQG